MLGSPEVFTAFDTAASCSDWCLEEPLTPWPWQGMREPALKWLIAFTLPHYKARWMLASYKASADRGLGNKVNLYSCFGRHRVKITTQIWQVLHLNFSQPNFLRAQDPIGQRTRVSKKPYSALLSMRAGLSNWAAKQALVGALKNRCVFRRMR